MPVLAQTSVIELTDGIAGSCCGLQLADAGADVIKVESMLGDSLRELGPKIKGHSSLFMSLNRDKRSIALDYHKPEGYKILEQLLRQADVIVEDLGISNAGILGCTYEKFRQINSKLIHCSITPYGTSGPYKDLPASELEIQGLAGSMWFLGKIGESPVRVASDIASGAAASLSFSGILAALYWQMLSGEGQKIEVSLFGSLLSLYSYWMADFSDPDNYSGGAMDPYCNPEFGYQTKDKPILFGFFGRREDRKEPWQQFCKSVGLAELLEDPFIAEHGAGMVGVGQDAQDMKPVLETALVNWSSDDLMKITWEIGGAGAPFLGYEDLFGENLHPQVEATEIVGDIPHPEGGYYRAILSPWGNHGELGIDTHNAPPRLGQDTNDILVKLGYKESYIKTLKENGIVK